MAATMRAAEWTAPGAIRIRRAAIPEPGPAEVLVRLEGTGVCASNLPLWEGRPWARYPLAPGAPGHEGWGRVAALGKNAAGLAEGDRVALISERAYAEYDLAPAAATLRLPEALAGVDFPGEALGCALNVFERAEISSGQSVAVVGVGFLGALLVALAVRRGARVFAISRRAFARELARRCGAIETFSLREAEGAARAVLELTSGRGCERVIEAAGAQETLDLAGRIAAERARLVIAGYHQDPRLIDLQQWNWLGLDVINAHERDPAARLAGMRAAAAAVLSAAIDPKPLLTHAFALEELPRAMAMLAERPEGFVKAVIRL